MQAKLHRMAELPIFRDVPGAVDVDAATVLFTEGDPADVMYAIVDGQVDLTLRGEMLETHGPGSIVGELALVDSRPRSTTAVTRSASRIVQVDRQHFMYLVHEHPTFALQVMTVMTERLRRANQHV